MAKKNQTEIVQVQQFVPSGQTIGELPDGRKIFIWGALPGETCRVAITKSKSKFAHGVVVEVMAAAADRVEPKDNAFLSTSPWQIVPWQTENQQKLQLLEESFEQHKIEQTFSWFNDDKGWNYRNKMEFSFWWDHDTGLELAFHVRGARHRLPVQGSSLASEKINFAAKQIRDILKQANVEARSLKTLLLRSSRDGEVYAALFVKDKDFTVPPGIEEGLHGLSIYFSNPKSPASVATKLLYSFGDDTIRDELLGRTFVYDIQSFFQVNIPVFESALTEISRYVSKSKNSSVVDLYSGVGSIGLSVGAHTLVDSHPESIKFARINSSGQTIIEAPSEKATDHIDGAEILIVDPPRAGLHKDVVEKINEFKPKSLVYLSCNPSTQARDIALLKEYTIVSATGYNFFPKTPHIESLVVLEIS